MGIPLRSFLPNALNTQLMKIANVPIVNGKEHSNK